jgi:hypothetical protein
VLGTTQKDFREFGEALEAVRAPGANVCAVASPEAAAAAAKAGRCRLTLSKPVSKALNGETMIS